MSDRKNEVRPDKARWAYTPNRNPAESGGSGALAPTPRARSASLCRLRRRSRERCRRQQGAANLNGRLRPSRGAGRSPRERARPAAYRATASDAGGGGSEGARAREAKRRGNPKPGISSGGEKRSARRPHGADPRRPSATNASPQPRATARQAAGEREERRARTGGRNERPPQQHAQVGGRLPTNHIAPSAARGAAGTADLREKADTEVVTSEENNLYYD